MAQGCIIVALAVLIVLFTAGQCSKDDNSTPASISQPATTSADTPELREQIATVLNLNGLLCARVTEVRPLELADTYEVTCVEYRGGSGEVRYILNAATGKAFRA